MGIGLVAYSPLGKGFLTGKIDSSTEFSDQDYRSQMPRYSESARKANQSLIDLIEVIGRKHEATPAQVAIAWILSQKKWIVPLFGTRKLSRFTENVGSLEVNLTKVDLNEIEKANIIIQGDRFPESMMKRSGL